MSELRPLFGAREASRRSGCRPAGEPTCPATTNMLPVMIRSAGFHHGAIEVEQFIGDGAVDRCACLVRGRLEETACDIELANAQRSTQR